MLSSLHVVASALRNRRIRVVLAAFLLFSAAEWTRWVGLLVYGFDRAGPAGAGWMSVIQLAAAAIVTPFSSGLADHYPRARVLIAAYVVGGVGTAGAGAAIVAGLPFLVVAVISAVAVVGVTLVRPTQASLMPQLATTPAELTAANVSASFVTASSWFIGPGIAAAVLSVSGPSAVLAVAGACLLLGGALVARGHRGSERHVGSAEWIDIWGGFREVARARGAGLIVMLLGLQAMIWGMVDILIVNLAIKELGLGRSGVGLLSASLGIGGLIGGAATVALVGRRSLAPAFALGVALWGAPILIIGLVLAPVPVVAMLAIAGVGLSFLDVSGRTLLQRAVSDEALGRVFGVLESGFMAAWGVGSVLAPVALRVLGTRWTFAVAGALLPTVTALRLQRLARIDDESPLPGPELDLLRAIDMFRPLPGAVLERLARHLTEVRMPAGSTIIREGDPGDLFYVVAEGEVSVTKSGIEIARLGSGSHFGEIALLRDVPRTASVTAVTDVRLMSLARRYFLEVVTGSTSSSAAAHDEVSRRLARQEFEDDV